MEVVVQENLVNSENNNENSHENTNGQNGNTQDLNNENSKAKKTKRKSQKKKRRAKHNTGAGSLVINDDEDEKEEKEEEKVDIIVEVEYVAPKESDDPVSSAFSDVFKQFLTPEELTKKKVKSEPKAVVKAKEEEQEKEVKKVEKEKDEDEDEDSDDDRPKVSKKAKKRLNRLSIAALKQLVSRPDVVEIWDTTAPDPRTLVYLKSYRNTVPVPRHWCQKRKYLQGKRGVEKPPFKLPDFIEATGIQKMREAYQAKDDEKKLKQKQREKLQPKSGKIDINYQVLHDAFFKFQTKPKLSIHGDLYYEGKEYEVSLKAKRPGVLSAELKEALGMTETSPPPWLINMQRFGPPPPYPNLRIPGINAPLPAHCEYGFEPGQWGQAPTDRYDRPMYGGNPFDPPGSDPTSYSEMREPTRRWGVILDEEIASSEEESEEEEEEVGAGDQVGAGIATPAMGLDSVVSTLGMQTPDMNIDLRKAIRTGKETPLEEGQQALFHVLPEHHVGVGAAAFASEKVYQVPTQSVSQLLKERKKDTTERVQVSFNPDELENIDESILKQKYAEQMQSTQDDDDDDEVDAGGKRKKFRNTDENRSKKQKHKEFKF